MNILTDKLTPPPEIEQKISSDMMHMLYENLPLNIFFHLTMSLLLCAILWTSSDHRTLWFWWFGIALVSMVRMITYYYFRQQDDSHTTRYWVGVFGTGSVAIGLLWGLAGVVLTQQAILSYELFVGFLIAGMSVGGVPVLSSVREVYIAFVTAAETPYIAHVMTFPGEIYRAVVIIHCAFIVLMLVMSKRIHSLIRTSLVLRYFNVDLVDKLQSSNGLLQGEVLSHTQTERKLRENEQRLSALVDASFEGIVLHRAGIILEANHAITEMTGYTAQELIGAEVKSLLAENSRAEVQKYIDAQVDYPVEAIARRISGEEFPVEIRMGYAPYRGENVSFVVARDITDYKQLLKTQDLARQKAEEADKLKTEFLAAVSHELRTPLNAVMGFTQLLEDTSLTKEQKDYLSMTQRSGKQLLELITDLLDLSRIESGYLDLEVIGVNLQDELNHILDLMTLKLEKSGNVINVVVAKDLPVYIKTDPLRLRQIMTNLIGNAIKFTEHGEIKFLVFAEEEWLCFIIKDTGKGIPEDKLEYVFGKFNQIDSSISRQHGGAGLGLAISKRLVDAMHGRISVTSNPDVGTAFRVDLPLFVNDSLVDQIVADNKIQDSGLGYKTMSRLNILLVEDDKINQMIAVALLKKFGHSITLAANGQEALDLCQQDNTFELIFMDIQMPVMDGITATQMLRKNGVAIPIIAMTAHAMSGNRESYLNAGMTDYISKPILKENLLLLLEQYQQ